MTEVIILEYPDRGGRGILKKMIITTMWKRGASVSAARGKKGEVLYGANNKSCETDFCNMSDL